MFVLFHESPGCDWVIENKSVFTELYIGDEDETLKIVKQKVNNTRKSDIIRN